VAIVSLCDCFAFHFLTAGTDKHQNGFEGPPPSPSTSMSADDKTSSHRPKKKRCLNGAVRTLSLKNKSTNENPGTSTSATQMSTPTADLPPVSPSKHNVAQLPKTNSSHLKCLKFNKKTQPSNPPPALATSSNINTPTKSNGSSMKPLDLARKSPQERAALRKSK
jgi:hypothetical protein